MTLIQIRLGYINVNQIIQITPSGSIDSIVRGVVENWRVVLINGDTVQIDKYDLAKILKV